ncbi:ABC transporter ATP-binding protein [Calditrichota bacterium LG25]
MKSKSNKEKPILEVKKLRIGLGRTFPLFYPSYETEFSIERNTILGIVGESGSGKTLTSMAILGIHEVYPGILQGEVNYHFSSNVSVRLLDRLALFKNVNGSPYPQVRFKAWRNNVEQLMRKIWGKYIGIVFQDSVQSLNPFLSVGSQMMDALTIQGISEEEKYDRVMDLLKEVNLRNPQAVFKSFPHELSGGMAQRVMIAMGIIGNPEFVMLDEPTIGLDVTLQAAITDLLLNIWEKRRLSGIIISHDLKFISRVTQKIMVMLGGEVWEIGPAHVLTDLKEERKHPYTKYLLLKSDLNRQVETVETGTDVPVLQHGSDRGCHYRTRCVFYNKYANPQLKKKCETQRPPMIQVADNHSVRCWQFEQEN